MHNDTNKQSLGHFISLIIYCILASITFILTFHYEWIEPDQPLEENDVPYEIDQPTEEQNAPYQVLRITWSCSGLERGGSLCRKFGCKHTRGPWES